MSVKISELSAASALGGTELLETSQGGVSKKLTATQIATFVDPAGVAAPIATAAAAAAVAAIPSFYKFDAAANYKASGMKTTTTGSITASTASLVVASATSFAVGQGIFVLGAGAAGANLVTTITVIAGTTLTLAANAGTTVSGVLVQHDDTVAINTAIAAAWADGGGIVYLRKSGCDGYYRCNGAFNGTTNGILTIPQDMTYNGLPVVIKLFGEIKGTISGGKGCTLDFNNHPTASGTRPSAISAAPYVTTTGVNYASNFNNSEVHVDNLIIRVPSNPTIGGINLANSARGIIGDNVEVLAEMVTGSFVLPINNTFGVFLPQSFNNVKCVCGACIIGGFTFGLGCGEHTILNLPYIIYTQYAIYILGTHHIISGTACLEINKTLILIDSPTITICLDLILSGEWSETGPFARAASDINDTGSPATTGIIHYKFLTTGSDTMTKSGAATLVLDKLNV